MRRKLLGIVLALLLAAALMPTAAFAAQSLPEIPLDLSAANTENDDYTITDTSINLKKADQVYVLTGVTDKRINMWGSNDLSNIRTFYLRLENAKLNGGIAITNTYGAKLNVEVAKGTENTVKRLRAANLTVTGAGTIHAEDLGTTQSDKQENLSAMYIKDTKIVVSRPANAGDSILWEGTCVLDGNADITLTSSSEYSVLKLGQTRKISNSLTMKGNSSLYCLQADAASPSEYYVSGIESFGAPITLQDNAYLEAQGRAGVNSEYGYTGGNAILSDADITVAGKAALKLTGYGTALYTDGNVNVDGGKIVAKSEQSNGIYAAGTIEIKNAAVEASGCYPAIFSRADVLLENSTVSAAATGDCAIYAADVLKVKNSVVDADGVGTGMLARNGTTVSGSWIETNGTETMDSAPDSITDSVRFNGNEGSVIGNANIPDDVTVRDNMKLNVPAAASLIIPEGMTLTNHGLITVNGTVEMHGTVICDSHDYIWKSDHGQYWQECRVCGAETEKAAIPTISLDGADRVCRTQDYKFSFTLPEGAKNPTYGYAFENMGSGDMAPSYENNVWTGTVPTNLYDANDHKFTLIVTATTADGFEFSAEKTVVIQNEHSGGVATCKDKAVCEVCGERYGELNAKNHGDLMHVAAKAATKDTEGNIEYWYCADCGKYYKDAAATQEITKADTVVKKLPVEDEKKPVQVDSAQKEKTENASAAKPGVDGKKASPKTGDDSNLTLWAALLVVSSGAAVGMAALNSRKKHGEN